MVPTKALEATLQKRGQGDGHLAREEIGDRPLAAPALLNLHRPQLPWPSPPVRGRAAPAGLRREKGLINDDGCAGMGHAAPRRAGHRTKGLPCRALCREAPCIALMLCGPAQHRRSPVWGSGRAGVAAAPSPSSILMPSSCM